MDARLADSMPPHSPEAESSLLCCMMLNIGICGEVSRVVPDASYMFDPRNQTAYSLLMDLHAAGKPVADAHVAEWLRDHGKHNVDEEFLHLMRIAEMVPSHHGWVGYAEIVRDKAVRRRLMDIGHAIALDARQGNGTMDEIVGRAEQMVFDACRASEKSNDEYQIGDLMVKSLEMARLREKHGHMYGRISTGWQRVDEMLTSFAPGSLIVVGADTGIGKSLFSQRWGLNMAEAGTSVQFYSLEMSPLMIGDRALSMVGEIDAHRLRFPLNSMGESDWSNLENAAERSKDLPFYMRDTPAASSSDIERSVRHAVAAKRCDVAIVDYLQIIERDIPSDTRASIEKTTKAMKSIARQMNVAVILISQLARESTKKKFVEPSLHDFIHSSGIENDADATLLLYDPWKRASEEERETHPAAMGMSDRLWVLCPKQRNGPSFRLKMGFNRDSMNIYDVWEFGNGAGQGSDH